MIKKSKRNYKHCYNCKYRKDKSYSDSLCMSPTLIIYSKGQYNQPVKEHPKLNDVHQNMDTECLHFYESMFSKIARSLANIKSKYYKWKHPEWFI